MFTFREQLLSDVLLIFFLELISINFFHKKNRNVCFNIAALNFKKFMEIEIRNLDSRLLARRPCQSNRLDHHYHQLLVL